MASLGKTIRGEVSPILSQFAVGYRNANLIGSLVAPKIQSLVEAGTLYTFGKEGFMIYDSYRALRAATKRIEFAVSKDTFLCLEHALESPLDYKELDEAQRIGAAKVLQLEQRAVTLTQRSLEIELEKAVADILLSGTYYASGNKITLTGTGQWSDTANSSPKTAVKTGLAAARADMGIKPNAGVIGYTAWDTLQDHPEIIERIKYSQLGVSTEDLVAKIFGLKKIFVGEPVYSSDAGVFTDIWGDNMALIYLPMGAGELVEGTTPHTVVIEQSGYPQVKTYNMKKTRDYETTRKYVVKNVSTSYGYLISDITA